jgi:hypothetical protein
MIAFRGNSMVTWVLYIKMGKKKQFGAILQIFQSHHQSGASQFCIEM